MVPWGYPGNSFNTESKSIKDFTFQMPTGPIGCFAVPNASNSSPAKRPPNNAEWTRVQDACTQIVDGELYDLYHTNHVIDRSVYKSVLALAECQIGGIQYGVEKDDAI
jgi:hypothetical protein